MWRVVLAPIAAGLPLGLLVCCLSLACGPTSAPPTTSPTLDPFAVVRATSQAAYQAGTAALGRGDYLQACVDLDTAKTNDPDNRPEIQQALQQALTRCLTPPPTPTSSQPVAQERTIVVATIAAGIGSSLASSQTPTPGPAAASTATPAPSPALTAPSRPAAAGLVTWTDPQGRFSIGAPADWTQIDHPQTLVGTGIVGFDDPSGRAEVDVAVDSGTRAVSPELYAASVELAMQQQVPGYASEQVVPGTVAGGPAVRRVYTFMQHDAAGQPHQARGFQVAIVRGSTPYLISGSAPAEQYQLYSPTFDQIVESFRFS